MNQRTAILSLVLIALGVASFLGSRFYLDDPWVSPVESAKARPSLESSPPNSLHDLSLLNRAVIHVKENYVDPARIDERKMIRSALESVQEEIDEVLVRPDTDGPSDRPQRMTIVVGGASQTFELSDVTNLWTLCFKLKDVFRFITSQLPDLPNPKEIEYAAINGLLSTLDPHSVLLRPSEYREMKLNTMGNFGGLGIVIELHDGRLTIVRPIPDTPASRSGLRAGDQIHRIGLNSTTDMSLDEAVELLRGQKGSKVELWIKRDGWRRARRFRIGRDQINVRSVHSRLLTPQVGLIQINQFQYTTHDELLSAIASLRRKSKGRLEGIVLDLRSNPGGLLSQAISIADTFIASGPLVTTVGYGEKLREPRMATRLGTQRSLRLAVLIDSASASASEIVAGALKNHNRAILIGQRTFGKGTVQVLYDNRDDSALKLTIAQYLTPGDLSIQSVGITPDVETVPLLFSEEQVDLVVSAGGGERNLPKHLTHRRADTAASIQPTYSISYLRDIELEQRINREPTALLPDFEINLALDLLSDCESNDRVVMLEQSTPVIRASVAKMSENIRRTLARRSLDWRANEETLALNREGLKVEISANLTNGVVRAGDALEATLTVSNEGQQPVNRIFAVSESDDPQFNDFEFIIGRLNPGQKGRWTTKFKVNPSTLSRSNRLSLKVHADGLAQPIERHLDFSVASLPSPRFSVRYILDDSQYGNHDGLVQVGETVELLAEVKNVGAGDSRALLGLLQNEKRGADRHFEMTLSRVSDTALKVGDTRTLTFRFKAISADLGQLKLSTYDPVLRWGTTVPVLINVVDADFRLAPNSVAVGQAGESTTVFAQPTEKSQRLADISGLVTARPGLPGWSRVSIDERLFGWVRGKVASNDGAPTGRITRAELAPPISFSIEGDSPPLVTGRKRLPLSGVLTSREGIRDLRVYLNGRKVFYLSADTDELRSRLPFATHIRLAEKTNYLTLVGRTGTDHEQRETFVVRRQ